MERGVVRCERPRGVGARLSAADRLRGDAGGGAARRAWREFEEELLRRRREYSILRVDRADLSKNVLRGFTAFDIFLEQHPEFAERITFTAQLMPSRTDVPEYAEYLEKIEALVAVVNHRHGTPDWMPIDLKLRDDLEEAVASYKHYDVMMVNAMFDGMNLVAKEGPLVNERDGVSILSENTGAHEELGEFALSVNPFDVQELADAIYAALTMSPEGRARRAAGLKEIVTSRDPGDWIDEDATFVCKQFGIDTDRPMICQVSRFDPWKDPMGVIDAYRIVKEKRPEVQLALVGSMASDDPEGWDFYNSTLAHADGDPDIHILNNFNNVGAIEVNAFQSLAEVVIQK